MILNLYQPETNKKNPRPIGDLQKVLSCNYNLKGDKIILSGCKNGQTDLFEFSVLGNSLVQITNDPFDNLYPKYRANSNVIIYS